ncbi:hypothetical protein L1275_000084 [Flavobacterium sp. HSC-61S13]|nr:hypothetical protein [Flavobacterium sp. HSC-61S13]
MKKQFKDKGFRYFAVDKPDDNELIAFIGLLMMILHLT